MIRSKCYMTYMVHKTISKAPVRVVYYEAIIHSRCHKPPRPKGLTELPCFDIDGLGEYSLLAFIPRLLCRWNPMGRPDRPPGNAAE